ncbi:amino acid adenylation domain-containing protein [Actinophytocola sp.]|uniref:amino acid adenylation domain-containing protein n=1 Tax=Actinophytocola sp. TaxID=1872138 RepID=UPI003D6B49FC
MTVEDAYPLASLQAGMLYHSAYEPESATYHDIQTITLRGPFDHGALTAALAELTARHAVLRTSFDLAGFSEPVQLVHRSATIPFATTDLTGLRLPDAQAEVGRWRCDERHRPLDWGAPPLLRTHAHLLPDGLFALSLSFHHAILDGWSVASLVTELLRRYMARLDGSSLPAAPPAASFRDLVAGERAVVRSTAAAGFWRDVVDDAPPGRLPRWPGYPRAGPGELRVTRGRVDAGVYDSLERVADELRVPLRTVLLAAHLRVIGLFTGQPEVLTGLVTHSRPESDAGDEVLGLFLNSVPVRITLEVPTWADLVRSVFAAEVALLPHRRFPLFEIQRLAGRTPLLDTLFDYRDFHVYGTVTGDDRLTLVADEFFERTNLPLTAGFNRSRTEGGLEVALSHDTAEFPEPQLVRILEAYHRVLAAIADPAGDPRPTAPYLAGDAGLIQRWNATDRSYPDGRLPDLVANGDRPAVCFAGSWSSYRELRERANRAAHRLRAEGVGADDVVGVSLERGPDLLPTLLGILTAGAAYLPLEPSDPPERTRFMVRTAGARLVLTESTVNTVDTVPERPAAPAVRASPDSLAYVIFTSGSTGEPKGVGISHRAIVNRLHWMQEVFPLGPDDRVLHKTPYGFDVSVWELFWPLLAGAGLVIAPPGAHRDADQLAELVHRERVTTVHFVPSMLEAFLDTPNLAGRLTSLRRVICSGEALPPALASRFLTEHPRIELHNLYGPTEAAIDVTWHRCVPGEPVVPIGRPIANTSVEITDPLGHPTPIGVPGELRIGGVQVARGYANRPALTAERFVASASGERQYRTGDLARWLPDGEIEYLGRLDDQVKIRGQRVEPGEIHARLVEQPEVRAAAVVVRDALLTAYVVTHPGVEWDRVDWRDRLRTHLPDHMVPSHYVPLDALPTTRNGKLDRAALPAPDDTGRRRAYRAPRDPVEATLAGLWEETLGVDAVGIHDDFFELGGHSLLALRLTMRIRAELGHDLPVGTVLTAPTVALLADALRRPDDLAPRGRMVSLRATGERAPVFLVHALGGHVFRYLPLARKLGDDQPVYAIAARGLADGEEPHDTLAEMVDDYVAHIREVRPNGPYVLGGFCIGGNIALELARRLRAAGEEVPLVVLFFSGAGEPVVTSSLEDDTALMLHALAGGPLDVDTDRLRELDPDERLHAVIEASAAAGTLPPDAADIDQARRFLRVFRANAHAVGFHRARPYDGDVGLFSPTDDPAAPLSDLGWSEVVSGALRMAPIHGDGYTILYEPQVADAATTMREWMDHGFRSD